MVCAGDDPRILVIGPMPLDAAYARRDAMRDAMRDKYVMVDVAPCSIDNIRGIYGIDGIYWGVPTTPTKGGAA